MRCLADLRSRGIDTGIQDQLFADCAIGTWASRPGGSLRTQQNSGVANAHKATLGWTTPNRLLSS
eukprot:1152292-Pelagomonas_calceolata.AAC.4